MNEILKEVIKGLNICECEKLKKEGYTNSCFFKNDNLNYENLTENYTYVIKEKQKYFYVNCGYSGVFMVEKTTGEIFNIKGYGTPDKNKKIKANLGNIKNYTDLDKIKILHSKRYNSLR